MDESWDKLELKLPFFSLPSETAKGGQKIVETEGLANLKSYLTKIFSRFSTLRRRWFIFVMVDSSFSTIIGKLCWFEKDSELATETVGKEGSIGEF